MDVPVTVDRIFESLRALGRTAADRRRGGLSSDDIVKRFKTARLYCHPDVLAAYEAADGTDSESGDTIGDLSFFPGYYWLPLHEAFETYAAISPDERWRDDWFPIFASGGGDFYAVICSDRESAFGSVLGFILGEPEQVIEFPTLGALLETVARSYGQGAFHVQGRHLKSDYPTFRAIAEQVSPNFKSMTVAGA